MYEILNDVPLRGRNQTRDLSPISATAMALQPGQSFVVPGDADMSATLMQRRVVSRLKHARTKRTDVRFVTRKLENGIGVWCLAKDPAA